MAVPLDTLVTDRPTRSAVYLTKEDELPETIGQHLFIHHALHSICRDAGLVSPDEQIRGMALGIWDGLSDRHKMFWTERAATARLVRDREDFLLTDGSTSLAKDHEERTKTAVAEYKRSLMSDKISVADTASIADTELTEEDLDDLDAIEPHVHGVAEDNGEESTEDGPSALVAVEGKNLEVTASSALQEQRDSGHDNNAIDSDRELRELHQTDTYHATLDTETSTTSIESLPPAEAESRADKPAGMLAKGTAADIDPDATADSTPDPSKLANAGDAVTSPGLMTSIASAASNVPAWIAQSLDWAEESQEQADREAAAQPVSTSQQVSEEAPAAKEASPDPDDKDPEEAPSRVLWVGSLRSTITTPVLKSTFAKFGRVDFCKVMPGKACGFVHFVDVESAVAAKRQMNGKRVINARDPLLIRFAEDRYRGGSAVPRQRVTSSTSECSAFSKTKPGSNTNESPQPEREQPPVASGNSVRSATIEDATDISDDRSITTAASTDTRSATTPNGFSAAQLEEAKRFASQATRGGKPAKGKPVTLSVAVEHRAKKAPNAAAARKGRIAGAGSGASTPMSRTPQEDTTPVSTPAAEKVPLAKWEEPVKVRDFGARTSIEPEPKDEDGKGKEFFLFHALPIICEDLEIDEPDDYAQSIASEMWSELRPEVKRGWIEDSRSLRGYSVRKPGLLSAQKRFQDSHFTKDYRSQILKALAIRNNGELKYLQPEFKKLMLSEKRRRKQEREAMKRQLQHAAQKEAEREEQERADFPADSAVEPGQQGPNEAPLPSVQTGISQDLKRLEMDMVPASHNQSTSVDQDLPTLPAKSAESPSIDAASASDPPPPYESDSPAAGSSSEAAPNEWKIAGPKSKSSAKDTAKRAMQKLPWNKTAKAPARG